MHMNNKHVIFLFFADVRFASDPLPPVRNCPHLIRPPSPSMRTSFVDDPFSIFYYIFREKFQNMPPWKFDPPWKNVKFLPCNAWDTSQYKFNSYNSEDRYLQLKLVR